MPLYEVYLDNKDGYVPKLIATVNANDKEDAKTIAIKQVRNRSNYNTEIIKRLYPKSKLLVYSV